MRRIVPVGGGVTVCYQWGRGNAASAGLGRLRVESVAVIGNDHLERTTALLDKARARLRHLLTSGKKKRSPSRLVPLVEISLVVLLGLAVGRILLTLFAPLPVADEPPPPRATAAAPAEVGNPFRTVAALEPDTIIETDEPVDTTLDLALHGTWVEGEASSATIRTPDGEQKSFSLGEAICCGATLEKVYTDRVTIARAGARETLRLANKEQSPAPPRRPMVNEPPALAPTARNTPDLRKILRIQPSGNLGDGFQLQLFPTSDEALFERTGLRAGDILVSINGRKAPESITGLAAMMQTLSGATEARIVVERNGDEVPIDISMTPDAQALNQ